MKSLLTFVVLFASLNSFAGEVQVSSDGGFELRNNFCSSNSCESGLDLSIPVVIKDDVVFLGTVGYINSETQSGYEGGSASDLLIGGEARTLILNKSWLEAAIGADYGFRLGGSTKYSNYSVDRNGKLYDPQGGFNAKVGVRLVSPKMNGLFSRAAVGAEYRYNFEERDGGTFLTISLRN